MLRLHAGLRRLNSRRWLRLIAGCLALAAMAQSCGPTVTVENKTTFEVSALVQNRGNRNMLSPSPGESSQAIVQQDAYVVTVVPRAEWLTHAKATRDFLNDQLKNSENLSGAQLLEVVRRLKAIALKMQAFEEAAKGGEAQCSGILTDKKTDATVTITALTDGKLKVVCK
jgi:hypothetical protein